MRTVLLLLALAACLPPAARAQANPGPPAAGEDSSPQRWVRFGITDADTLWYDPDSARGTEPGVYRVWVMEARGRGATLPTGERYGLVRELSDFDCATRRSRRRELIFMLPDETRVRSYAWTEEEMEWREPIRDSDAAFILREVCERMR